MGSGAIIAAAVAAHVVHENYRRAAEERRRTAERHRKEEEQRRRQREEDERRRREQDRQRREEEHRKREADSRRRRFNNKLKNGDNAVAAEVDFSALEFTDKFVVSEDYFPACISKTEFEKKYADGSYATFDKEDVLKKNYNDQYHLETEHSYSVHLLNGVTRTYVYDGYRDGKYHLIREELPDGRMKSYDFDQNVMYERDAEGNYKSYKHLNYTNDIVVAEVGTANGWSMRYEYKERYNGKKYEVVETKESFPDGKYQVFNEIGHFLKEEKDVNGNIHKWSEHGKLLEEELVDGTIYRWNEFEVMTFEKLPTGEETHWNNQGIKTYEALESGETREWTDKGDLIYEKLSASEERRWNKENTLIYERTADGKITEWTENGNKCREKLADNSETRWFPDTDKVCFQSNADGVFKEFDELGRVVRDGTRDLSHVYRYYGDSPKVLDKRTFHGYGSEDKSAYEHYDKKGNVDTEHYKAIKKIAKERMQKEDELSQKKGKKIILPKMSSIKKAVVYHQQLRKLEKDK